MQAAAVDTARSDAVLCLRNISKAYGPVQVLSQVNVDIRPGEVLALLGENGAGKSTLSSIIAGLVQPEAGGSMTWLGAPYAPASPGAALGAGIGLITRKSACCRNCRSPRTSSSAACPCVVDGWTASTWRPRRRSNSNAWASRCPPRARSKA